MNTLYEKIFLALERQGIASENEKDIIIYGLDMFLYTGASLLALLLIGMFLGYFKETFIIVFVFILMQGVAGGYHANTHCKCFVTMVSMLIVSIVIHIYSPLWLMILLSTIAIPIIWILVPVEHINAPMSFGKKKKMKLLSRLFLSILIITGSGSAMLGSWISKSIAVGIFCSALSVVAGKLAQYSKHGIC